MKKRVQQLSTLTLVEWKLLVAALFLLPAVALMLRLFGFLRTKRLFTRLLMFDPVTTLSKREVLEEDVQGLVRMVNVGARYGFYRANCLKKSLVLYAFLLKWGLSPEIRLGVQRRDDQLYAHSWVELKGEKLAGAADVSSQFSVLY